MRELFLFIACTFSGVNFIRASCFGNGTSPQNTTSHPCFTGAVFPNHLLPPQHSIHPQQVYPQSPFEFPIYRPNPYYPQPGYQPGSSTSFIPGSYQTEYNPYYRPNDISRLGYAYPSGYRGPHSHMGWQPQSQEHNYHGNYMNQIPARYSLTYGHPNMLPVHPAFQKRTYVVNNRPDHMNQPIFMDRGTFTFVGRDAELTCAFFDSRYRLVSNVAWVKVTGPYEAGSLHPPFECHRPGCHYTYINQINDFRFRVITLGQTSTLRIYDYIPADQGIYRCAATAHSSNGHTVTVYKIIEFFNRNINGPTAYPVRWASS